MILVRMSPTIKRSEQDDTMDTLSSGTAGVPFIQDTTNNSVIRNLVHHTNDTISNLRMRPCFVQFHILEFNDPEQHCVISKCRTKNCKTCNILITYTTFASNLTNTNYFTRTYDNLNCKSDNVIYGLECNLCGLAYVGETKGKLYKRICDHRSGIINNVLINLIIRSFQCEFVSSYHRINNPNLATPLRRQKEDYLIRD